MSNPSIYKVLDHDVANKKKLVEESLVRMKVTLLMKAFYQACFLLKLFQLTDFIFCQKFTNKAIGKTYRLE